MGVGTDDGAVEHVRLPARVRRHAPQGIDDPLPEPGCGPALWSRRQAVRRSVRAGEWPR